MNAGTVAPCLLIVASQREDRRALFDALDGQEVSALHTARDVAQARALLAEQPRIDLVIVDFVGEAAEEVAFCMQLRAHPRHSKVPVLGLLAADPERRVWGYRHRPPGVSEWIHSPIDADEVISRVRAALTAGLTRSNRAPDASPTASEQGADYAFAFVDADDEWLVSDADSGALLEANPAFERRSGWRRAQWSTQTLHGLLQPAPETHAAMCEALQRDGVLRRMAQRVRADQGRDAVEAVTRMAVKDGRLVHVTCLHDRALDDAAQQGLDLLARLQTSGSGDEGVLAAARLLADAVELDYVAVYSARPEDADSARLLALEQRRPVPEGAPDPIHEPALKLVLGGELLYAPDADNELAQTDGFVQAMQFAAFGGWPLLDERRNVLGALLVGSSTGWKQRPLMSDLMRVAAARFAFELELRRAREQGRAKGLLDGLTGLPNRLLFNDRLENILREARRTGEMFAVMFVDLDRFKSINDSLGHAIGDEVLLAAAQRLRDSVRSSDTVARYAGDEFTVILRHIVQHDDVLRIAEKVVRLMDTPLTLADGSELHITASIGVSFYPDDASSAEHLLKHADVAMYNAKGMGRNNYQAFVAGPDDSQRQRMALESKLRQAERNGELRVYYQPQVSARTEDIVGMEALVRWEHPELGMISPGFFIPLAEETGLIISIGEWVLRTACHDARRWQQRYRLPLRVGVNLSALQMMQPGLVDTVGSALDDSGLPPNLLELEITESISVKSVPQLMETLKTLHEIGCRVAIDDFGTGQSSLDYLRRVPAHRIKIDQSFVRNIGVDPDDEAIVRATINMAHSLKRSVVAEGVEIEAHLEFLRAQGCDELQGYLFCRPLPPVTFDQLLAERQRLLKPSGSAVPRRRRKPATQVQRP